MVLVKNVYGGGLLREGPTLSRHRRPILAAIILGHITPSLCQEHFMDKWLKTIAFRNISIIYRFHFSKIP